MSAVAAFDQHRRLAVARRLRHRAGVAAERVQDEALDPVGGQRLDRLALALAVVAEVEQHHQVAGVLAAPSRRRAAPRPRTDC